MKKLLILLAFIGAAQLSGIIGSLFTAPNIDTWYSTLVKPAIAPPNWIFAPVWTLLFLLMGIASYIIYKADQYESKGALITYGIQLVLNILWSVLFFGLRSPLLAFFEITILWVAILVTIIKFYKIKKIAGYLLVPYILWVWFASILNLSIVLLNQPTS